MAEVSLRKSSSWLITAKTLTRVVDFAFGVALARILFPEDFGYLITIQIFTGVASLFAAAGMSQALIRKKDASQEDIQTVFSVQMLIGVFLTLFFVGMSPFIADLFDAAIYLTLMPLAALNFLLRPFKSMPTVLLNRRYQFKQVAIVTSIRSVIAGIAAVSFALADYAAFSLVLSGLIATAMTIPLMAYFARWKPKFGWCKESFKNIGKVGVLFTSSSLITYVREQVPKFAISKVSGPTALGLFNKGESLADLPIQILMSSISAPLFRRMSEQHDNPQEVQRLYFRATQLLLIYMAPLYIAMSYFAEPFIVFVYGERWQIAGEILTILALIGLFRLFLRPASVVMRSQTMLNKDVQINLEVMAIAIVYLSFFWQGEVMHVVWLLGATTFYQTARSVFLVHRFFVFSPIFWWRHIQGVMRFVALFATVYVSACYWLLSLLQNQSYGLHLLIGAIVFPLSLLSARFIFPHPTVKQESDQVEATLRKAWTKLRKKDLPSRGSAA